jgi:hypothetical protein
VRNVSFNYVNQNKSEAIYRLIDSAFEILGENHSYIKNLSFKIGNYFCDIESFKECEKYVTIYLNQLEKSPDTNAEAIENTRNS